MPSQFVLEIRAKRRAELWVGQGEIRKGPVVRQRRSYVVARLVACKTHAADLGPALDEDADGIGQPQLAANPRLNLVNGGENLWRKNITGRNCQTTRRGFHRRLFHNVGNGKVVVGFIPCGVTTPYL